MTSQLLLISLGPIQDFIASARRCQDLWFGSWLLSDLARVTAAAVASAPGATVVFPAGLADATEGERPGVANLILARLPGDADVRALAATAEARMTERLHALAREAWRQIPARQFHGDLAHQQLDDLMELLWVSLPEVPDYAGAKATLMRRLAALKNTRAWPQPAWTGAHGAGVPKSSLDGLRESVLHNKERTPAAQRYRYFRTKGAEHLCGVGLLKRLGCELEDRFFHPNGRPTFHSTAHVAATPLLERIAATPGGPAAAGVYLDALRALGLDLSRYAVRARGRPTLAGHDGVLLFPNRLRDHFAQNVEGFAELKPEDQEPTLTQAAAALRALQKAVGAGPEPCPYYVFLLADGDRMGKALDGVRTLEGHQDVAAALNAFAADCRALVTDHHGSLLFSGGDDVLALLPLHRALPCARALATRFAERVQPAVRAAWPADGGDPIQPTLSVGLAIVHAQDAMSEARERAKQAEKAAKHDRNSLAVLLSRRSGADRLITGPWDAPVPLDARLEAWRDLLDRGDLSSRTAADLEAVALHVQGLPEAELLARADELLALVRQVLAAKQRRGGGEAATGLPALLESYVRDAGGACADRVAHLAAELQVALALQPAFRDATPTPQPGATA